MEHLIRPFLFPHPLILLLVCSEHILSMVSNKENIGGGIGKALRRDLILAASPVERGRRADQCRVGTPKEVPLPLTPFTGKRQLIILLKPWVDGSRSSGPLYAPDVIYTKSILRTVVVLSHRC